MINSNTQHEPHNHRQPDVQQTLPFNTGWHLAHHADMGVPFQQLPALHDELVTAGWVTPAIEYRTYSALWKALADGDLTTSGLGNR